MATDADVARLLVSRLHVCVVFEAHGCNRR
jgi:hypothetical protein